MIKLAMNNYGLWVKYTYNISVGVLFICASLMFGAVLSPDEAFFSGSDGIIVLSVSGFIILIASITYDSNQYKIDFVLCWLITSLFVIFFIKSWDFIYLFVSLIGFSIGIYALMLGDCEMQASREACVKYFYFSIVCVALFGLGILLSYNCTGTTDVIQNADVLIQLLLHWQEVYGSNCGLEFKIIIMLLMCFVIPLLFKMSAFPAQFWLSPVYQGSSDFVLGFLMIPSKIAAFYVFMKLYGVIAPVIHHLEWDHGLAIIAVTSLVYGAVKAFSAHYLRGFLAYTSINQMGFIMLTASSYNDNATTAALLYIFFYGLMSTFFFLVLFRTSTSNNFRPMVYVTDLPRATQNNILAAVSVTICMFSMVGLPPLPGFFIKYKILLSLWGLGFTAQVVIALVISLLSSFYYLRIIKLVLWTSAQAVRKSWIFDSKTFILFGFHFVFWTTLLYFDIVYDFWLDIQ